ncbi:MAG: hypothetical protein GX241_00540 [Ruminococcaceae bacterium]|nr:hypothetical protein [Oscillospiraceae bacterium]
MNLIKKIVATLLVLVLAFSFTGCGKKAQEDSNKNGKQEKVTTEEKKDKKEVKKILAEELVTKEEMSAITGFEIETIDLYDNDFLGLLGGNYRPANEKRKGFTLYCYQQPYCGAANDDVDHPEFNRTVKAEYEKYKSWRVENKTLEVVEDLGQDAFWDTAGDTLFVLYNDDYYLNITDNVSKDSATKKAISIKIAEKAVESLSEKVK